MHYSSSLRLASLFATDILVVGGLLAQTSQFDLPVTSEDGLWVFEGDSQFGHVGWAAKTSSLSDRFPCFWSSTGSNTLLQNNGLPGEATDYSGSTIIGFLRGSSVAPVYWTNISGSPGNLIANGPSDHYPLAISSGFIGGFADTGTQQIPEYWASTGASNTILSTSIWPSTWNGRFTDVSTQGGLGSMAVGYRDLNGDVPASAFVYRVSPEALWLVDEPVSSPVQMTVSGDHVYFVGGSVGTDPAPYLWTGRVASGSLKGNALDFRAFATPETENLPQQVTGINSSRQVGGVNTTTFKGWIAGKATSYGKSLLDTANFVHEPAGGSYSGTAADAQKPDGAEFRKSKTGFVSSTIVRITVQATVPSSFNKLWFRSTSKVDTGGSFNLQTEFYNWQRPGWDVVADSDQLKTRYTTYDHEVTSSAYVSSSGLCKARLTVLTGLVGSNSWYYLLEQAVWISR